MRFALIEDKAEEQERVRTMLADFCRERMISFTTDVFTSGEEFLAGFVPMNYDVVFMDIYMEGMTGIEAAKQMRGQDSRSVLIFLTTSAEHMGDAFSTHAFDYLLKPIQPDKFVRCLTDVLKLLPKQEDYFSFLSGGVQVPLLCSDICVLRSQGHSTIVVCEDSREYPVSESFVSFTEPLMERDNFLLVSRGILVNLDYVTGFSERECLLQNGMRVPITLRKQKQLTQIWRNYDFAKLHRETSERGLHS